MSAYPVRGSANAGLYVVTHSSSHKQSLPFRFPLSSSDFSCLQAVHTANFYENFNTFLTVMEFALERYHP